MTEITDALAGYITVLADSLSRTARTEDRPRYVAHLAQAAVLFSLLHRRASREAVEEIINQERRTFGLGYLSGLEGEAAEAAFAALAEVAIR